VRKTLSKLTILCASISLIGCGMFTTQAPRTVLVAPIVWAKVEGTMVPSDLVKLGPQKIQVYVKTDDGWILSSNEVSVEGWLATPPPPKKEN